VSSRLSSLRVSMPPASSNKCTTVGFAPPGWETTHRYLQKEGIPLAALKDLGLAIRRKTGHGFATSFAAA
jgi:hypothetical protein